MWRGGCSSKQPKSPFYTNPVRAWFNPSKKNVFAYEFDFYGHTVRFYVENEEHFELEKGDLEYFIEIPVDKVPPVPVNKGASPFFPEFGSLNFIEWDTLRQRLYFSFGFEEKVIFLEIYNNVLVACDAEDEPGGHLCDDYLPLTVKNINILHLIGSKFKSFGDYGFDELPKFGEPRIDAEPQVVDETMRLTPWWERID